MKVFGFNSRVHAGPMYEAGRTEGEAGLVGKVRGLSGACVRRVPAQLGPAGSWEASLGLREESSDWKWVRGRRHAPGSGQRCRVPGRRPRTSEPLRGRGVILTAGVALPVLR